MLYRKAYEKLRDWKNNDARKALLVTGARQIGKTYLVREFGLQNYENFVEINFITDPRAASIFSNNLNAETLVMNMTAYLMKPMLPGKTLFFFE